jgi:thymidylate synthase (FAD)
MFVRKLIERGHESVLEHGLISVLLTCDRGVTHEAVRHRIASYSQESTRYCNYSKGKFGAEITYIDITRGIALCPVTSKLDSGVIGMIIAEWLAACWDAEHHYMQMINLGASPQIARSVLNNSTKTGIVISMNPREWRHFFKLRNDPTAHPQMREVAGMMLAEFKNAVPVIFDDLEV